MNFMVSNLVQGLFVFLFGRYRDNGWNLCRMFHLVLREQLLRMVSTACLCSWGAFLYKFRRKFSFKEFWQEKRTGVWMKSVVLGESQSPRR